MTIRKKILLAVFAVVLWGLATAAFAHPPKAVNLAWNSNGTLTVTVDHPVNDPQKHYINKIIVYVDDKIVTQKEYQSQASATGFTDTFQLGALSPGTKIKAEAFCIIMGSSTGSITVP